MQGLKSRAAFKLLEVDKSVVLFVIDLLMNGNRSMQNTNSSRKVKPSLIS